MGQQDSYLWQPHGKELPADSCPCLAAWLPACYTRQSKVKVKAPPVLKPIVLLLPPEMAPPCADRTRGAVGMKGFW